MKGRGGGPPLFLADRLAREHALKRAASLLDERRRAALAVEGRAMELEAALDLAAQCAP